MLILKRNYSRNKKYFKFNYLIEELGIYIHNPLKPLIC